MTEAPEPCIGCVYLAVVPDDQGRWWCANREHYGWMRDADEPRCEGEGYQRREPQ